MSKPTIKQIAELSGVSIATVSRYINNTANISPATAKRISDAMQNLQYTLPKEIALPRTEKSKPSSLILINSTSMTNPGNVLLARGVQDAAALHGYQTLVNIQHLNVTTETVFFNMLANIPFAGAILFNSLEGYFFSRLYQTLPFVQCSEINEDQNLISTVSVDDTLAVRRVVDYLFSIHRSDIALLTVSERYMYGRHRKRGYLEGLEKYGRAVNPNWILTAPDSDYESAFSLVRELFDQDDRPNAILAASDIFAMAAIHACQDIGLSVPKDVVVTGFDNVIYSRSTSPMITTVDQPLYRIGYVGCELLIDKINNPESKSQQLTLDTQLLIRGSTLLY